MEGEEYLFSTDAHEGEKERENTGVRKLVIVTYFQCLNHLCLRMQPFVESRLYGIYIIWIWAAQNLCHLLHTGKNH